MSKKIKVEFLLEGGIKLSVTMQDPPPIEKIQYDEPIHIPGKCESFMINPKYVMSTRYSEISPIIGAPKIIGPKRPE